MSQGDLSSRCVQVRRRIRRHPGHGLKQLGNGTQGWKEGEAVAVYPLWGCGHCPACAKSAENHCVSFRPEMPRIFGGLGRDGGMAELIYFSKCLMERNLCIPVFSAAALVA